MLNIPEEHYTKFVNFLSLPTEEKNNLYATIKKAEKYNTLKDVAEYIVRNTGFPNVFISDVLHISISLLNTQYSSKLNDADFVEKLKIALEETNLNELLPTQEVISSLKNLLKSAEFIAKKARVIDLMSENSANFFDCTIIQDIRPSFSVDGKVDLGVIIQNLTFTYQSGQGIEEIILSLDANDLEVLKNKIIEAQAKSETLIKTFSNINIINV